MSHLSTRHKFVGIEEAFGAGSITADIRARAIADLLVEFAAETGIKLYSPYDDSSKLAKPTVPEPPLSWPASSVIKYQEERIEQLQEQLATANELRDLLDREISKLRAQNDDAGEHIIRLEGQVRSLQIQNDGKRAIIEQNNVDRNHWRDVANSRWEQITKLQHKLNVIRKETRS